MTTTSRRTESSARRWRSARAAAVIAAVVVATMVLLVAALRHQGNENGAALVDLPDAEERSLPTSPAGRGRPHRGRVTVDSSLPAVPTLIRSQRGQAFPEGESRAGTAFSPGNRRTESDRDTSDHPGALPTPERGAAAVAGQPARDEPAGDRTVRWVTAGVSPPAATATATRKLILGDWEDLVDPNGDSRFERDRTENRITIEVPGAARLLSAEIGRMNAPRLLRPVRGDFVATARLASAPAPSARSATKAYAPYQGAGFLLWQDAGTYVRFEIAADVHHGNLRPYANFELRRNGALAVSWGIPITDGSTYLRFEKRGDAVRAAFSADGTHWTRFEPITADFDSNLSIGIVAVNSSKKPLTAELDNLEITTISPAVAGGEGGADAPLVPEARPLP